MSSFLNAQVQGYSKKYLIRQTIPRCQYLVRFPCHQHDAEIGLWYPNIAFKLIATHQPPFAHVPQGDSPWSGTEGQIRRFDL